jgi:membrane protease subunit HflK
MAKGDSPTEDRVRRSVARQVSGAFTTLILLGALAVWVYAGFFRLQPGEDAVILRLGRYSRTVTEPGLRWHLPPPIEMEKVVRVGTVYREQFGDVNAKEAVKQSETAMQTKDNNIVHLEFVVRYRIGKPYDALFQVTDLRGILRDSAQAAMREVVGRSTIDGVLSDERGQVQAEATDLLQKILDEYETGISVMSVDLQEVQPPQEVRAAFDEVIAANQDRNRKVNEAQGYANEVLPKARAEAAEVEQAAIAYHDTVIAQAKGGAGRFEELLAAYQKAPRITEERMYLDTMEALLPDAKKILIDPGTATILPTLPLGGLPAAPKAPGAK